MKTKILTMLMLLSFASASWAQSATQQLVVWLKDGSKVHYQLSDEPKTTFENGALFLSTNSVSVSYPIENLLYYTYEGDMVPLGVDHLQPGEVRVSQGDDAMSFRGLRAGTPISVYSIDGKLLSTQKSGHDTVTNVSFVSLPAGTYIIKVNNQTIKFRKK